MKNSNLVQEYIDLFHSKKATSVQSAIKNYEKAQASFESLLEVNKLLDKAYHAMADDSALVK